MSDEHGPLEGSKNEPEEDAAPEPTGSAEPTSDAQPPGGDALRVDGLVVARGGTDVIRDISFTAAPGEIVALFGPSGAGKSTLVSALSGRLRAREGSIHLGRDDLTNAPRRERFERGIVTIPQRRHVFPSLTVNENVSLGAAKRHPVATAEEFATTFPMLAEIGRVRAGGLSPLQQRMVSLARAAASEPSVLVIDEPSTGLNPGQIDEVLAVVAHLRSPTRAIIVVEQDARRALAVADRGIVLDLGKIRAEGPSDVLLDDSTVVGRYLGGGMRLRAADID